MNSARRFDVILWGDREHRCNEQGRKEIHMSAHTPGPTTGCGCCLEPVNDITERCDLCSEATGMNDGVGWRIRQCPTHAAAPELLEVVKSLLAWSDHTLPIDWRKGYPVSAAKAAIAKAEGRGLNDVHAHDRNR